MQISVYLCEVRFQLARCFSHYWSAHLWNVVSLLLTRRHWTNKINERIEREKKRLRKIRKRQLRGEDISDLLPKSRKDN